MPSGGEAGTARSRAGAPPTRATTCTRPPRAGERRADSRIPAGHTRFHAELVSQWHHLPHGQRSGTLIILGIILVLIGWLASISILTTIGIILIVVGVVLAILGSMGRAVGGRKHWY